MQRSELEKLSRKELQALAKENGVKANLSNNDIIAKLSELSTNTVEDKQKETISTELISVEETPPVVEEVTVLPETEVIVEEVAPIVENEVLLNVEELTVGDSVEVNVNEVWTKATVKRVNKKTVRVCLMDTREELTVKFDELRAAKADEVAVVEEIASTIIPVVESVKVSALEGEADAEEQEMEIEAELVASFVENKNDTEQPPVDALETEDIKDNTTSLSMEVEEAAVELEVEAAVEPMIEAVITTTEVVEEPQVVIESIPQAPPTPIAASTRVSSIGWSVLDSAVKCVNPSSNRRKERRNARRSAMKQLAESMKMESEQTLPLAETDAEEQMEISQPADEPVQAVVEEASVPEPVETVEAPEEVVQVPEVAIVALVEVPAVVAPTPAAFVASTPAAPAPAVAVAHSASSSTAATANKGDMLPRMNKAQAMRLGAIQKKIVTSDTLPAESVAFTAKAARPSLAPAVTVAMTPAMHKRNSISTSAPSTANQLHQPGAPFRKPATPLSGRASMLTSGTKRKMSDFGCNSANSTAPDFKRLHTKQFSALKSIAECVDQDKGVGVRMTIAMESAMTTTNSNTTTSSSNTQNHTVKTHKATPQAAPVVTKMSSASVVAKQPIKQPVAKHVAVNPFSKVVSNTPSKKTLAASTPSNALASRPGSATVHTGKAHGPAGGSSNIIKSRTVTSFVSATATAPSSCGHNNLTSFVNNENTASQSSVHNSAGPTSFLKSKGDSVGAGKHRTVMLSGTSGIRQQHLTML